MINFNDIKITTTSFQTFKLSTREKTNSNFQLSNSITSINSNSTNEILGYKIDKDGYFTEEFNETAYFK